LQRPDRFVSPGQLSRALGLGESTVKRWIDQGRIPADKTPGGHRRIRLSDALHLLRSGGIPGTDPAALGFAGKDDSSLESLAAVLCSDVPERAVKLLEGLYASGLGAGELADQWIAPAMHHVGCGWETGHLPITGEHRAMSVMLRALHGLLRAQPAPAATAPRAFVAGLARDPYLLAPLCAQLVLGEARFQTTNFGPDTPPAGLLAAVREQRPALVAVSFSVPETSGSRSRAALGAACRESGSALAVGGRGLRPDLVDDLGATVWCRSMTELDRMARHLASKRASAALARTG
jgi:excisionase family DNA binding protein